MKTARVYTDFTSSNGYGAYLNGLKFFNRKNEELPVTDIVSVNSNKVTFKLNNVPGTIDIVNNYGGSYVSTNIFTQLLVIDSSGQVWGYSYDGSSSGGGGV